MFNFFKKTQTNNPNHEIIKQGVRDMLPNNPFVIRNPWYGMSEEQMMETNLKERLSNCEGFRRMALVHLYGKLEDIIVTYDKDGVAHLAI